MEPKCFEMQFEDVIGIVENTFKIEKKNWMTITITICVVRKLIVVIVNVVD